MTTIAVPEDIQGFIIDDLGSWWWGVVDTVLPANETTMLDTQVCVVRSRSGYSRAFGLSSTVTVDFDVFIPADSMAQRDALQEGLTIYGYVTRQEKMGTYPFIGVDREATTTPVVLGLEHNAWRINFEVTFVVAHMIQDR